MLVDIKKQFLYLRLYGTLHIIKEKTYIITCYTYTEMNQTSVI